LAQALDKACVEGESLSRSFSSGAQYNSIPVAIWAPATLCRGAQNGAEFGLRSLQGLAGKETFDCIAGGRILVSNQE
jgi:hypothetical protein